MAITDCLIIKNLLRGDKIEKNSYFCKYIFYIGKCYVS